MGGRRSIGTIMLMSRGPPFSLSCSTCNEPMPTSLPSASITPAPPQN